MAALHVQFQLPPVQADGAPQLPYGADPGTFTETLTENDVVQSIFGALQRYNDLPAAADADGYHQQCLHDLSEQAFSSDDLNCLPKRRAWLKERRSILYRLLVATLQALGL
jgi:hypothetical protein